MQPLVVMYGEKQPDNGERWAFENNSRMVDYEQPCDWNYRTGKPIGWEQITVPAVLFDAMLILPDGVRNVFRRVPNIPRNPLDGERLWG